MSPYITERVLHQSPALAPLGATAVQRRTIMPAFPVRRVRAHKG